MQPIARDGLTRAEVVERIGRLSAEVDAGVDLLDEDLRRVRRLAMEPEGSQVVYQAGQAVRLRASLVLSEPVEWGTARLRPWTTVDGIEVRLGVYRPALPATEVGSWPQRWQVDCYDLTADLNRPHGATVRLQQGGSFLGKVDELCAGFGLTVSVGGSGDAPTATRDRIWPLDAATTTLDIVNDLLEEAGYRNIWMRGDGVLRCSPDYEHGTKGAEWTYDTSASGTTVGPIRRATSNRLEVPNRLVAISGNATAWNPTTGDGVHIIEDQESIGREGLRNAVVTLDAVNQAQLVSAAEERFAELTRVIDQVEVETLPNPFHYHEDVVRIVDPDLQIDRRFLITGWTYFLDGSQMPLTGEGL